MSTLKSDLHSIATVDLDRLKSVTQSTQRVNVPPGIDESLCWDHRTTYEFVNGERVTLEAKSVDQTVWPVVGEYRAYLFTRPQNTDPHKFDISAALIEKPVIGWQMNYRGNVEPMAPGANVLSSQTAVVVVRVGAAKAYECWPDSLTFDSLDEWVAHLRARWIKDTAPPETCSHCGHVKSGESDTEIPF